CREIGGTAACVPLASEDCRPLAEKSDLERDDTVWIGAMLPFAADDPTAPGLSNLHAIDLARQDFVQMRGGFAARPLAVLACDDSKDAARAMRHLALDVRAPAVIGFRSAAELIELAGSTLIPNDMMA